MLIIFFIGSHKVRKNLHTFCLISPRSSLRLIAMNGARCRDANLPLETSMRRAVRRTHEEAKCIAAISACALDVMAIKNIFLYSGSVKFWQNEAKLANVFKGWRVGDRE